MANQTNRPTLTVFQGIFPIGLTVLFFITASTLAGTVLGTVFLVLAIFYCVCLGTVFVALLFKVLAKLVDYK